MIRLKIEWDNRETSLSVKNQAGLGNLRTTAYLAGDKAVERASSCGNCNKDQSRDHASSKRKTAACCGRDGGRTQWGRTLAAFTLGADQEAEPQCDGEVQDHGIDDGHSVRLPTLKRRLEGLCVSQERLLRNCRRRNPDQSTLTWRSSYLCIVIASPRT